jgi:hypothetical protein
MLFKGTVSTEMSVSWALKLMEYDLTERRIVVSDFSGLRCIGTTFQSLFYSKEVKIERKLTCSRAHGGLVPNHSVPHPYVMYLWSINEHPGCPACIFP